MEQGITFTCKMGSFVFNPDVNLERAKGLRDTVAGQFFNPKPGARRIRTEEDIYMYVENDFKDGDLLKGIPFEVTIHDDYKGGVLSGI